MVWVQDIWVGKVDRLSSSSNAIVNREDIRSPNNRPPPSTNHVNIGPLPKDAVGEDVIFAYKGGTYGICLDTRWFSSKYLEEMEKKSSVNTDPEFYGFDIPKSVREGDIVIAEEFVSAESNGHLVDLGGELLVKLRSTSDEADWSCLGLIQSPLTSHYFPIPVRVTNVCERYLECKISLENTNIKLPEKGEVITAETTEIIPKGTLASYRTNYDIPVLIKGAEYPIGRQIDMGVTSCEESYLVGDVPLNSCKFDSIDLNDRNLRQNVQQKVVIDRTPIEIRQIPEDAPDTTEIVVDDVGDTSLIGYWNIQDVVDPVDISDGDLISLQVEIVEQDIFIGYKKGFPVRCECSGDIPKDLEGEEIRVRIQSVSADKAVGIPASPEVSSVESKVVGTTETDAITLSNNHLVRLPEAKVVSADDTIRVGINTDTEAESIGTVDKLPIFEENEKTIIRLPGTEGDLVYLNGVPVDVTHLPDLKSPVTLGVDEINSDHITATVSELPTTHTPNRGEMMTVVPEKVNENVVVGVGEELPVELPLLPAADAETAELLVGKVQRGSIFGVVSSGKEGEELDRCYSQLRSARVKYQDGNYEECFEFLSKAREDLPKRYLTLDAVITAFQGLIRATSVTVTKERISETVDLIGEYQVHIDGIANILDTSEEVIALLEAYQNTLKATKQFLIAIDKVDMDVETKYQAIARGATGKREIDKGLNYVNKAEHLLEETKFDREMVLYEIYSLLPLLYEEFPYPVDSLEDVGSPQSDYDCFHILMSQGLETEPPVDIADKNKDVDVWTRPSTPNEPGIFPPKDYDGDTTGDSEKRATNVSPGKTNCRLGGTSATEGLEQEEEQDEHEKSKSLKNKNKAPDPEQITTEITEEDSDDGQKQEVNQESEPTQDVKTRRTPVESRNKTESPPSPDNTEELRRLRKKAEKQATEDPQRENVEYTAPAYDRSEAVRRYALERANGICEACGRNAPFTKPDGEPYLEVHHTEELGEGGADDPSLVIALCPTCHKEIHYGEHGEELNKQLKQKLDQGLSEVGTTDSRK